MATLLVVGVMARDPTGADMAVTGVTFNSVALTKIRDQQENVATIPSRVELWRLLNPSVGTFDIVVSFTGTVDNLAAGGAISLKFVDATTPIDVAGGAGTNADTGTEATHTNTPVTDGAWIIDVLFTGDPGALAAGGGQTEFAVQENVGVNGDGVGMSREGPIDPAAGTTINWTWGGSNPHCQASVAIRPAADADIVLDAVSTGTVATGVGSLTWQHTVASEGTPIPSGTVKQKDTELAAIHGDDHFQAEMTSLDTWFRDDLKIAA